MYFKIQSDKPRVPKKAFQKSQILIYQNRYQDKTDDLVNKKLTFLKAFHVILGCNHFEFQSTSKCTFLD